MWWIQAPYTGPVTDYPDWQAAPATSAANQFTNFSQDLTPGTHAGTVTPVSSWSSLTLRVNTTAGAAKVSVKHYADQAGTELVDTDTWTCKTTAPLTVRVPLRARYVQLSIDVTSAVNFQADTYAVYSTYPADRISFPVGAQQKFVPQTPLAASATVAYDMPAIAAGRAYWSYVPYDTNGQITVYLQTVDELDHFLTIITDRGTPTVIDNAVIEVPDALVQIVVSNNDGVNSHDYAFSLMIPPQ